MNHLLNRIGCLRIFSLLLFINLLPGGLLFSQDKHESVVYLEMFSREIEKIETQVWDYVRSAAHTNNASSVEDKRKAMLETIDDSIEKVKKIEPYNDDKILKSAFLHYLQTLNYVLKEEFAKIVNMEEIAEQSYDLMEAYILAKEKANQKLKDAAKELSLKEKEYAKKNNIRLISTDKETTKNLNKAGEVGNYYNTIYLIFFKANKQEIYLLDALGQNDISKVEQNRLTLIKYSDEGLKKIKKIKSFQKDSTLKDCCAAMLNFYKEEAVKQTLILTDFLMKKEMYEKIKKAFDLKREDERTQADVDLYNKKVNELNDAGKKFNETVNFLNEKRKKLIMEWNEKKQSFFDNHVPH